MVASYATIHTDRESSTTLRNAGILDFLEENVRVTKKEEIFRFAGNILKIYAIKN